MNTRIKDLEDKARELSQHCSILDSKMEAETNSRTKDRDTPEFHMYVDWDVENYSKG